MRNLRKGAKGMKYVVHKHFVGNAICGNVDLPVMTVCDCTKGYIHDSERVICFDHSENAYQHFARNDDGKGLERGNLTQRIIACLKKAPQEVWDKVWEDSLCQKYKRPEHCDYWLWNHDFYNAEIDELRYIAELVGA
jgi:hypothetical protein